jgi:hypothetical protein
MGRRIMGYIIGALLFVIINASWSKNALYIAFKIAGFVVLAYFSVRMAVWGLVFHLLRRLK